VEDDKDAIVVSRERLARLRKALKLASEGSFAEAQSLLATGVEDGFKEFEQDLQVFMLDLKTVVDYNGETISALMSSKRDLLEQLSTIGRQQETIRELSTPLIDVWDGVIAAPLVGRLERERVRDLSERMLRRIADAQISWVLLDMTGIDVVDTDIAGHLLRLARSVRLMGARCALTGIRPQVAQAFVTLGISLDELQPVATLKEGLRRCIASG
jgi:rsbT co-antagonist protein RsbR